MVGLGSFGASIKLAGLAVLVGGTAGLAHADSFYLQNGEVVEGTVVQGTLNTLMLGTGTAIRPTSFNLIERVVLDLSDGSELSGELLSWKDGVFEVRAAGEVLRVADGKVLGSDGIANGETSIAVVAPSAPAASEGETVNPPEQLIVMRSLPIFVLKSGDSIVGRILHATGSVLTIRPEGGATTPISRAQIETVNFESEDGNVLSGKLVDWVDGVYQLELGGRQITANLPDDVVTAPSQQSLLAVAEPEEDTQPAAPVVAEAAPVVVESEQPDAAASLVAVDRESLIQELGDLAATHDENGVGVGGPANETDVAVLVDNEPTEATAVPAAKVMASQHLIQTEVEAVDESGVAVVFKFQLDKPATRPLVVLYAATEASAKAGEDFESKSGVITFSTGSSYAEVQVPIIDDDQNEGEEEFNLFLSGDPETIAFSERQIAVTISDND